MGHGYAGLGLGLGAGVMAFMAFRFLHHELVSYKIESQRRMIAMPYTCWLS